MADTYISDNGGNRAAPGAINCDPVPASGLELDAAGAGTDYTQAVVAGARYAITIPIDDGTWLFSITGVTSTAANREWIACEGDTIDIKIPSGKTTLYFESDTIGVAHMRRLN